MTRNGTRTEAGIEIGIGGTATAPPPVHGTDLGDTTGTGMTGTDMIGNGIESGRGNENATGKENETGTGKERGNATERGNVIEKGTGKGGR